MTYHVTASIAYSEQEMSPVQTSISFGPAVTFDAALELVQRRIAVLKELGCTGIEVKSLNLMKVG